MRMRGGPLVLTLLLIPIAPAQTIEGAGERTRFEPGDRVLYETPLAQCPVGEFLPQWHITTGSYECARFQNQMWIRPLERGTVLSLALPPLPAEFSLEFTAYPFQAGGPLVQLGLHDEAHMPEFRRNEYAYGAGGYIFVQVVGDAPWQFGAQDQPGGARFDFQRSFPAEQAHQVAIQVRRGQVRFFVDGELVGKKPFAPTGKIGGISLWFHRRVETQVAYKDAPVLIDGLRLATYSAAEAAPLPEQDLIRALGAEQTPEGLKVTLAEAILFDLGKWELKPQAAPVLDQVAQLARARLGLIRVEGHTDNTGGQQLNRVLSELRAYVVAMELVRRGIDVQRLASRGYGDSRPVASNDTEEGRAKNRRVEIIISGN